MRKPSIYNSLDVLSGSAEIKSLSLEIKVHIYGLVAVHEDH